MMRPRQIFVAPRKIRVIALDPGCEVVGAVAAFCFQFDNIKLIGATITAIRNQRLHRRHALRCDLFLDGGDQSIEGSRSSTIARGEIGRMPARSA